MAGTDSGKTWTIDEFLALDDAWNTPVEKLRELLVTSIREAAEHHYENNAVWRRLCEMKGFHPSSVRSMDDLASVPVLSTRAFKEGFELLSVPEDDIIKVHKSSGSSGNQSKVPRDALTIERFRISMKKTIPAIQKAHQGFLGMMGPSPEDMGDLAIANYAQVGCELADGYAFYLKDYDFDPEEIIKSLNAVPHRPVHIGGGPMLILDLADWIMETGQKITSLTPESCVTSGGGFKDLAGVAMERDAYDERVMEAFGVTKENIRDAYSMSELNGITLECEHHFKHLPPWIHLSVRNPANPDEEVPPGEEGLPVFLDPLAHSYPGFIMADDIVSVGVPAYERCPCGRLGPGLSIEVRRAEGAEEKGCGRHVAELKAEFAG